MGGAEIVSVLDGGPAPRFHWFIPLHVSGPLLVGTEADGETHHHKHDIRK